MPRPYATLRDEAIPDIWIGGDKGFDHLRRVRLTQEDCPIHGLGHGPAEHQLASCMGLPRERQVLGSELLASCAAGPPLWASP
jgi:hypothetical protein